MNVHCSLLVYMSLRAHATCILAETKKSTPLNWPSILSTQLKMPFINVVIPGPDQTIGPVKLGTGQQDEPDRTVKPKVPTTRSKPVNLWGSTVRTIEPMTG